MQASIQASFDPGKLRSRQASIQAIFDPRGSCDDPADFKENAIGSR